MGLQGDCVIIVCLLWWCYQGQLHGVEPGLSQEAACCQKIPSTETHLLRMSSFPLNPSKGFPESSSMSTGPHVFEVMILCVFMALKSLSYGHVMSRVWSKSLFEVLQGTLNVSIGHRPNILDLYLKKAIINNWRWWTITPVGNLWIAISQTSEVYSLCKETSASMVGSGWWY